jgi:hypothetical protein
MRLLERVPVLQEFPVSATSNRPSRPEQATSLAILFVLPLISLYLMASQRTDNPAVVNQQKVSAHTFQAATSEAAPLLTPLPAGIEVMSPAEHFTPDTLSDKINGKAELYISAGVTALTCQRFHLSGKPDTWVEIFVYAMGRPENAFTVFSAQRRSDTIPLALAPHAYRTANALFFVDGTDYVEMIATATDDAMHAAMEAMAGTLLARSKTSTATVSPDPKRYFPEQGLLADSMMRLARDAFGFDQLDDLYTVRYRSGDSTLTAFVSWRADAAAAKRLATAYGDFLRQFGGREMIPDQSGPSGGGIQVIEVMEAVELIFTQGPFLAGIHMGEDLAEALVLGRRLQAHLAGLEAAP